MIITTMNDLPGYRIDEVLGEVFGLTVRSRNLGSQIGAGLKSLVGGELRGMTKMLAEGRQHATDRLVEEAEAKGANAIIAFRFDTSELGSTWTEICAYGTAVRAARRAPLLAPRGAHGGHPGHRHLERACDRGAAQLADLRDAHVRVIDGEVHQPVRWLLGLRLAHAAV